MNKWRVRALLVGVCLFFLNKTVFPWDAPTHKDHLTFLALELLKQTDSFRYGPEIWDRNKGYQEFILQGAWDEDFPCDPVHGIRANNHYRHALTGTGLTCSALPMGDRDVDALTWAKSNPHLDWKEEYADGEAWGGLKKGGWDSVDVDGGIMSWEKAINRYDYTEGSKRLAYYTLGFILHLLQDMGCSEHVHDDPHGDSGYHGFESWAVKYWKLLKPDIRRLQPKRFSNPERETISASIDDYFINLSKIAYGIGRFHGGDLRVTSPYIDPDSNFARMFDTEFHKFKLEDYAKKITLDEEEWFLLNVSRVPVIEGEDTHANRFFSFNPRIMREFPFWAKGAFSGDWWPTHMYGEGSIIAGPLSGRKTRDEVLTYVQDRFTDKEILNEGQYNEMIVGKYENGPSLRINRLFRLVDGVIEPR